MPNRVVREGILDSDRVNRLTWAGEVFYRRLHSIVDDYGCFDGRSHIIRLKLFPLKIDKVSLSDTEKYLRECVDAGLVRCYEVDGKPYVMVNDFHQTIRQKRHKYPMPPDLLSTCTADAPQTLAESKPDLESNPESNPTSREAAVLKTTPPTFKESYEKKKTVDVLGIGLKEDQFWIDVACMKESKSPAEIFEKVDKFVIHCQSIGILENTESDFKRHFFNWSGKRNMAVNNGKTVSGGFPDYYDAKLESQLKGKDLSNYWKHLNEKGWRPVKKKINGVVQVVDWIKEAA